MEIIPTSMSPMEIFIDDIDTNGETYEDAARALYTNGWGSSPNVVHIVELKRPVMGHIDHVLNLFNAITDPMALSAASDHLMQTCLMFGTFMRDYLVQKHQNEQDVLQIEAPKQQYYSDTMNNNNEQVEQDEAPSPTPSPVQEDGGKSDLRERNEVEDIVEVPDNKMTINGHPISHIARVPNMPGVLECHCADQLVTYTIPNIFSMETVTTYTELGVLKHDIKVADNPVESVKEVYTLYRPDHTLTIEVDVLDSENKHERDLTIYSALDALYDVFNIYINGERVLRTGVAGVYVTECDGKLEQIGVTKDPDIVYYACDNDAQKGDDEPGAPMPSSLNWASFLVNVAKEGEEAQRVMVKFVNRLREPEKNSDTNK